MTYKRQPGQRAKRKYQHNDYLADHRQQSPFPCCQGSFLEEESKEFVPKQDLVPSKKVYEGSKDPKDHLGPKSVDNFEELSQKFLEEFSQQKRYAKDPREIYGIKRRLNEGLHAFMDRYKSKSLHIKGVPPVLRISAFMHGHRHPKLAKKLNDKIPKTMDEMFERVRAFIKGEVEAGSTEAARALVGQRKRPYWMVWNPREN
nr:reverse transcriptase domain-containing protein [Tanacetum cinerariifolium]